MHAKYLCGHQNGFCENLFFGPPEKLLKWILHKNLEFLKEFLGIWKFLGMLTVSGN
jgi:hypothetical protein